MGRYLSMIAGPSDSFCIPRVSPGRFALLEVKARPGRVE